MRSELAVRVTPRSSQNKILAEGGVVKVWVSAPPTDGQANDAVSRIVAKHLGLAATAVWVLRGQTARTKILAIDGLSDDELKQKLGILGI